MEKYKIFFFRFKSDLGEIVESQIVAFSKMFVTEFLGYDKKNAREVNRVTRADVVVKLGKHTICIDFVEFIGRGRTSRHFNTINWIGSRKQSAGITGSNSGLYEVEVGGPLNPDYYGSTRAWGNKKFTTIATLTFSEKNMSHYENVRERYKKCLLIGC